MKKLTKFLTTALLSITAVGVFSAAFISNNSYSSEVKLREAKATTKTIHIGVLSYWWNSKSLSDFKLLLYNGSSKVVNDVKISNFVTSSTYSSYNASVDTHNGYEVLTLTVSSDSITKCQLHADYWTMTNDNYTAESHGVIPYDSQNDFFIINTNVSFGNQYGFWTKYEPAAIQGTDNLFFAPNYSWSSSINDSANNYCFCWPYLEIVYKDSNNEDAYYSEAAYGVTNSNPSFHTTNSRPYVFYFKNVPQGTVSDAVIYFSPDTGDDTYSLTLDSTNLNHWNNGLSNLFAISSNSTSASSANDSYLPEDSKTMVIGSFAEYDSSDIKSSTPSYSSSMPTTGSALHLDGNKYTLDLEVDVNDEFKYYTYSYFSNGNTSSGYYDHLSFSLITPNTSLSNITIVDENLTSGSPDIDDYLTVGTTYGIKFIRGGTIEISRTINVYSNPDITITFKSGGRSSPIASDPSYALVTSVQGVLINDDINLRYTPEYNYKTGRYEVVLAALGTEKFAFYTSSDVEYTIGTHIEDKETVDNIENNGLSASRYGATQSISLNVSTGYYVIGWYPFNEDVSSSSNRDVMIFIDTYTPSTSEKVDSLYKSLAMLKTCDCNSSIASKLKALYGNDDTLKNGLYSKSGFNDYDYTAYVFNGNSYEGLSRTTSTNAYAKYLWIQYLYNGGDYPFYAMNNIENSLEYKESNNVIVIVVAATSLLAIASLAAVNFLAIKKKRNK